MDAPGEHSTHGSGRLLAGRYRVREQLGRGGMGVVCRAVDEVLGREVAVKELRAFSDAGPSELADLRRRMQREARAAARVRHPGVIAVHDIAEHEGRPVIVMELVHGPSLDDVLRDSGTLPPRRVAGIGAAVLDALAAAHRAGVLHRDVKPANILLEDGGRVVLTDFGIAAVEDPGDGAATRLTGSGELVGSLDYLAPERARGEQPGPASDLWSLGATLYAALEGASPFRRTSTWSTLTAIVAEPLPEPRDAGPLGPVLAELLDKDPARRADAARAARLLTAVAQDDPPPYDATLRLGRDRTADGGVPPVGGGEFGEPTAAPAAVGAAPPRDARADTAPGGAPSGAAARRGRRRAVAASVAAVLLAGAGVTYAFVAAGDGDDGRPAAAPTRERDKDGGTTARAPDRAGKDTDDGRDGGSAAPESPDGGGRSEKPDATGGPSGSAEGEGDGEDPAPKPGGDGNGTSSGSDGTGGGDQSCQPSGGGRYDCRVWRTATSYDDGHQPVGELKAGTNYFLCQKRLAHRETSGRWTNVWWARTDDDSGNTGVYVSVVYVAGGANDQPVPGLPTC
ncbi:serine/threonine-protein kinase [Streptomyces sp. Z26]|uniref:serine/threonine-protein kinase n=1 Tax=Streptomyces sp. Z26 TaxID=2500177 RepID=UPI001F0BFA28|nr:serine/threonine-protein kinase [Streptomyces sp. Z26]